MRRGFDFDRDAGQWHGGPWTWHHGPLHWFSEPGWLAVPFFFAAVALYFLPSLVAFWRRHHNRVAIALLNLLLGWTFFGWAAALVWAATTLRRAPPGPD